MTLYLDSSALVKRYVAEDGSIGMGAAMEEVARWSSCRQLRTLDALHLAAALTLPTESVIFATWDVRLHRAARTEGLRTFPTALS